MQVKLGDILGQLAQLNQDGSLRTVEPYRLAGGVFNTGSGVPDPNFWTAVNANGGTAVTANAQVTLATNTTANGSSRVSSVSTGRYISECVNQVWASIQFGDAGTVNNTRRWGPFNGTDGAYFKLAGTTLSVCTMKGGVETAVPSSSWNRSQTVPNLLVVNQFSILYNSRTVTFFINGAVVHVVKADSATWANTVHFPVWADNVNANGSTTNMTMQVRTIAMFRMGRWDTEDRYVHITGAGTTVCKYGPGVVHRVVINTLPNSGNNTLTIYDNTAASGTVMAVITGGSSGAPVSLSYDVDFYTGLTVVSAGTAWDVTVIYQ